MTSCIEVILAKLNDAREINDLLNLAYRGEQGWTNEHGLVSGHRSVIEDVEASIKAENSLFLIHKQETQLKACICLEQKGEDLYLGSFAVRPELQSSGIGTAMLNAAEKYAIDNFLVRNFVMVVLSDRADLISFYERRGYQRNDINSDYPQHLNVGIPKQPNLKIEQLIKHVQTNGGARD